MSERLIDNQTETDFSELSGLCAYAVAITRWGSSDAKSACNAMKRADSLQRAAEALAMLRECQKCYYGRIKTESLGTDCPQGESIAELTGIYLRTEEI